MTTTLNRPDASRRSTPNTRSRRGSDFHDDHAPVGTPRSDVVVEPIQPDTIVAAVSKKPPCPVASLPSDHRTPPMKRSAAALNVEQHGQCTRDTQSGLAVLFDPSLLVLAEAVDGFEDLRKSSANRMRILTRDEPDSDGEERGFGLTHEHPAIAALQAQLDGLKTLEHGAVLALQRQFRTHPLHPWVKAQNGLGEKTVARLLASIGDPYWNTLHDRPRTVGELFAYCGVAGPGQRRRRGEVCNWNATGRMRLWIIVGPIIRGKGHYRDVYDAARAKYAEKVHTAQCAQCGKKGQPAPEGSEWRDGHKHAGAIRLVMREILRDLWAEAARIHAV